MFDVGTCLKESVGIGTELGFKAIGVEIKNTHNINSTGF